MGITKKNWLEYLAGAGAAISLIYYVVVYWIIPAIMSQIIVICVVGGIVLAVGGVCFATPIIWKAKVAFDHHDLDIQTKRAHLNLLSGATQSLKNGHHVEFHHDDKGRTLKVHNPFQTKVQEIPAQQPQNALLAPVVPQAPVYAEVDALITDQRLVLCYTQEGPVFGTVADLLSMCVVGKPGRGKSTALLYYILILLKAGAEVWIWDPHSGLNDLRYGLNYADDLGDIEASCPKLHNMLEQRRKLWKEQKRVMHPLLLLVDEMPVIKDYEDARAKEVKLLSKQGSKEDKEEARNEQLEFDQLYRPSRLLKKFVLEARKWNCYVILSGQALPAEVLSTLTRDNMSSRIVFESCNMHAKMAGLQKEQIDGLLPSLKGAGPGVAVMDVSRWSKPVLAAIPNTTVEDLRAFIDEGRTVESNFIPSAERELNPDESNFQRHFYTRDNNPYDELLSSIDDEEKSEDYAQETAINGLAEGAQDTQELRYVLDSVKVELFTIAYKITGNIDESLKQIGVHTGYRAHARKIIAGRGLRKV